MPGAILSDVGSVKYSVVKIFSKFQNKGFNIIPSHPIAGTEKSGPESGSTDLFKQRWCVLTPTGNYNKNSLNKVKKMWINFIVWFPQLRKINTFKCNYKKENFHSIL